jgi:hypothetical protein
MWNYRKFISQYLVCCETRKLFISLMKYRHDINGKMMHHVWYKKGSADVDETSQVSPVAGWPGIFTLDWIQVRFIRISFRF